VLLLLTRHQYQPLLALCQPRQQEALIEAQGAIVRIVHLGAVREHGQDIAPGVP
jgi:hypothetical protein